MIEAYKELKTDKKLVIAGATSDTDGYVKMLKEMAGDDPNIIFTGFVSGSCWKRFIVMLMFMYCLLSWRECHLVCLRL